MIKSSDDEEADEQDSANEDANEDVPGAFFADLEVPEFAFAASLGPEPNLYRQALMHPDVEHWTKAAEEEINAHSRNGTWELDDLPAGCRAIGSRWVFKVKRNADGSIECYKARLVAKGFSQRPGFDFNETLLPQLAFLPFAPSSLYLPWRTSTCSLSTSPMRLSMGILRRRSSCSSQRDLSVVSQAKCDAAGS